MPARKNPPQPQNYFLANSHPKLIVKVESIAAAFKKVVKLDLISELLLKTIGYSSPSNTQINDLSQKLIAENMIHTCPHNKNIYISSNQIQNLSTHCCKEFYTDVSFSSEEKDTLQQGFYIIKEIDELMGCHAKFDLAL